MTEQEYVLEFEKLYCLKKKELVAMYMKLIYTEEELNTTSDFSKFCLRENENELMRYNKSALIMWIINKKEEVKK